MADKSSIEWTETTWNPVVGCTKVSSGCANCYAERMAKRLSAISKAMALKGQNPGRTAHYQSVIDERGRWSGRVVVNEDALQDPRAWNQSRIVFVNSMSDLFHDEVPLSFIRKVFRVMNEYPQHTFQVLTKRPERAAELSPLLDWTPNIWMGTSVENNDVIDRIQQLRRVSAQVRFLSIEPLLGPLHRLPLSEIHWVIVGGESGPGSRALEVDWVTQIRDHCLDANVPFFFKQWGGSNKKAAGRLLEGRIWDQMPERGMMVNA